MSKLKPYERSVYYYETDKMCIVHHSYYARMFGEARTDLLRQLGFSLAAAEAQEALLQTLSVHCEYRHPLVFGEPFAVHMSVTEVNELSFEIAYSIVSRKTGQTNVTGRSVQQFVDKELIPIPMNKLSEGLTERLAEYIVP